MQQNKDSFLLNAKFLFSLILCAHSIITFAQTSKVFGYVNDAETKEPLAGVQITFSEKQGVITNDSGFFFIESVETSSQISFLYLGYETKSIYLQNFKNGSVVFLYPDFYYLQPVVISADKTGKKTQMLSVSVATLQADINSNRITFNAEELANQAPGVFMNDGQANIRSGSGWSYGAGSRVAVLLDGMPLLAAGSGQALWNYLPVEQTERMEVIKGAAGVLYGSSALNGVIDLRTQTLEPIKKTDISLFSGFYDQPQNRNWRWGEKKLRFKSGIQFNHQNGNEKWQYAFGLFGVKDDGYRMGEADQRIRLNAKARYVISKKSFFALSTYMQKGENGSFLLWEDYDLAYTALDSNTATTNAFRWHIDPQWHYLGKNTTHEVKARILSVDNKINNSDSINQDNLNHSQYFEYKIDHKPATFPGFRILAGATVLLGQTKAAMFQGLKSTSNAAIYSRLEKEWKRFIVDFGLRYEYFRIEDYQQAKPVISAGCNWQAAKQTFIRGSYGQGFRFPVVAERYINTRSGPIAIFPNETLEAETGDNAELGIRQNLKWKNIVLFIDAAAYIMRYDNMMEFSFGVWRLPQFVGDLSGIGFKSVNIGKATVKGLDFTSGGEWKTKHIKVLWQASYTYANAQVADPLYIYGKDVYNQEISYLRTSSDSVGKQMKYRPDHLARADVSAEYKRWSFGFSYRYNSAMKNIDEFFVSPLFELLGPKGIARAMRDNEKGANLFDLRAAYKISSKLQSRFIIHNILNQSYMNRPADMRPPRSFTLQLALSF